VDEAVADLSAAAEQCRSLGAVAFTVEAECELAAVLGRRGGPSDAARARRLATDARAAAARLGMARWERLAARSATPPAAAGPLSARELEIAELVAQGLTNREIATAAFVSERTAQTHVQHILAKLGFSNRSQIASWVVGMRTTDT
jgi:DNA-binding NarL/FixJ family response regulator